MGRSIVLGDYYFPGGLALAEFRDSVRYHRVEAGAGPMITLSMFYSGLDGKF